jgi:predicted DNA-binding transcriptional regulator AlpA
MVKSDNSFNNEPKKTSLSLGFNSNIKPIRSKDPDDYLTHAEMCHALGISPQTGYDWRCGKSARYKADLAKLATYLSSRTVRFRRGDIQDFAAQRRLEVKL